MHRKQMIMCSTFYTTFSVGIQLYKWCHLIHPTQRSQGVIHIQDSFLSFCQMNCIFRQAFTFKTITCLAVQAWVWRFVMWCADLGPFVSLVYLYFCSKSAFLVSYYLFKATKRKRIIESKSPLLYSHSELHFANIQPLTCYLQSYIVKHRFLFCDALEVVASTSVEMPCIPHQQPSEKSQEVIAFKNSSRACY